MVGRIGGIMSVAGMGIILAVACVFAKPLTIDITFEQAQLDESWTLSGAAGLTTERAKEGQGALYLGANGTAEFVLSEHDMYGTVTMWIYDSGVMWADSTVTKYGPRWGLTNSFGDRFVISMNWAPSLNGNRRYTYIATSENSWYSRWDSRADRSPGWHKFTFIHTDPGTLRVLLDDVVELSVSSPEDLRFMTGFTGLYFYGGVPDVAGLYVDAISIEAY